MLQISHTTSFSVFLSPRTTSHYSNWSVRYGLCALTPYVFKHFAGELQALSLSSCSIKPSYLSSYFASESPFGTLLLNLCPGLEPRPCPFESHQSLSCLFVTSSLWLNTSSSLTTGPTHSKREGHNPSPPQAPRQLYHFRTSAYYRRKSPGTQKTKPSDKTTLNPVGSDTSTGDTQSPLAPGCGRKPQAPPLQEPIGTPTYLTTGISSQNSEHPHQSKDNYKLPLYRKGETPQQAQPPPQTPQ